MTKTKLFVDELEADDATLEPTELADPNDMAVRESASEATRLVHALRRWEIQATVWVSRDGRHVPVREMDSAHLQNTVRYLRREARKRYGSGPVMRRLFYRSAYPMTWRERLKLVWLAARSLGGRRPGVMFSHFPKLLAEMKFRKLPELDP